ncbi:MAG TPA: hemerythrin domain-containing protein [Kofleriaceae bacterium]|nr:hemerythrin domain-containing protein [Kofleriaceae bacterium]
MSEPTRPRRRDLIHAAGSGAALFMAGAALFAGCAGREQHEGITPKGQHTAAVSPDEDLMREHGLLERILQVYEASIGRIEGNRELQPEVLANAAGIVRSFIEDYHQKLEEDYVFPKVEQIPRFAGLVGTLRAQHAAGRRLTDTILRLAPKAPVASEGSKAELVDALREYIRMYRPHAAREDTVIFPAFHELVSAHEYSALGKQFEQSEHRTFGKVGFASMVDSVAKLERDVGIHDLALFTPKPTR